MSPRPIEHLFQSTRPVRGGTTKMNVKQSTINISIHPPRAGRDGFRYAGCNITPISIHPPRAGRDIGHTAHRLMAADFNPPAPCGAGRAAWLLRDCGSEISIHPPRAGRDVRQSARFAKAGISIHPPRAGRDRPPPKRMAAASHFNPPAPCGAGPYPRKAGKQDAKFQSTRPVRGGTVPLYYWTTERMISIHPPRAGRDGIFLPVNLICFDFNPPAPCGAGRWRLLWAK